MRVFRVKILQRMIDFYVPVSGYHDRSIKCHQLISIPISATASSRKSTFCEKSFRAAFFCCVFIFRCKSKDANEMLAGCK